jgi:glycosyltransferase involved in cell wall biosynthesis
MKGISLMHNPLISIIIPVYNGEAFLEKCLQSLLAQTYTNLEIILINDGSTDGSGVLCDAIAASDLRVTVIHKINGGAASARNSGLDIAKGEFVGFVDCDDTIEPTMYEYMYNRIKSAGADVCICGHTSVERNKTHINSVPQELILNPEKFWETFADENKLFYPLFCLWNKLIRRSLLNVRIPDGIRAANDSWLVADCIAAAPPETKIVFLDIPLYNYLAYNNPGSLATGNIYTNRIDFLNHLEKIIHEKLPQRPDDAKRAVQFVRLTFLQDEIHNSYLHGSNTQNKMTFSTVREICSLPVLRIRKFKAVLLCVLPPTLYRLLFKAYDLI